MFTVGASRVPCCARPPWRPLLEHDPLTVLLTCLRCPTVCTCSHPSSDGVCSAQSPFGLTKTQYGPVSKVCLSKHQRISVDHINRCSQQQCNPACQAVQDQEASCRLSGKAWSDSGLFLCGAGLVHQGETGPCDAASHPGETQAKQAGQQ